MNVGVEVAFHDVHERVLKEVDLFVGTDEKVRERCEPVILRGRKAPERGDGEIDERQSRLWWRFLEEDDHFLGVLEQQRVLAVLDILHLLRTDRLVAVGEQREHDRARARGVVNGLADGFRDVR